MGKGSMCAFDAVNSWHRVDTVDAMVDDRTQKYWNVRGEFSSIAFGMLVVIDMNVVRKEISNCILGLLGWNRMICNLLSTLRRSFLYPASR